MVNELSEEQLDFVLTRFISEVIREDDQEYPGKTLYEMIGSIQTFLRVQCKRNVTLIDKIGCTFRSSLLENKKPFCGKMFFFR